MIREFNYTSRAKFRSSGPNPEIEITHVTERGIGFDFSVEWRPDEDRDLPADGSIVLECVYRTQYQRYSFGTVSAPFAGRAFHVQGITSDSASISVKVVDGTGRILARADGLRAASPDEIAQSTFSFVDISSVPMNELWRVKIEDGKAPTLELNASLGLKTKFQVLPELALLVLPGALRQILLHYCIVDPSQESKWAKAAKDFAVSLVGTDLLVKKEPDLLEVNSWVGEVVEEFSRQHAVASKFKSSHLFAEIE